MGRKKAAGKRSARRKRKSFSREKKLAVVRAHNAGIPAARLGAELGITPVNIYLWSREVKKKGEKKAFLSGKEGDPLKGETHTGGIESTIECSIEYLRNGATPFHKNTRLILDLCFPNQTFDEQMRRSWRTNSGSSPRFLDSLLSWFDRQGGELVSSNSCRYGVIPEPDRGSS